MCRTSRGITLISFKFDINMFSPTILQATTVPTFLREEETTVELPPNVLLLPDAITENEQESIADLFFMGRGVPQCMFDGPSPIRVLDKNDESLSDLIRVLSWYSLKEKFQKLLRCPHQPKEFNPLSEELSLLSPEIDDALFLQYSTENTPGFNVLLTLRSGAICSITKNDHVFRVKCPPRSLLFLPFEDVSVATIGIDRDFPLNPFGVLFMSKTAEALRFDECSGTPSP